MRNPLIGIATILLGAAVPAGGCGGGGGPKGCTLIGCQDQFTASVRSADGSFPNGMHRIELLVGSVTLMCTFTFPLQTASGGGLVPPACPSGLIVSIPQAAPPFVETISLAGTPGQVHAWQYVDDAPILDVAVAPTYQDSRPNGPACEPVCRQASVSWTLTP